MRGDGVDLKGVVGILAGRIHKERIIVVSDRRIGEGAETVDLIPQLANDFEQGAGVDLTGVKRYESQTELAQMLEQRLLDAFKINDGYDAELTVGIGCSQFLVDEILGQRLDGDADLWLLVIEFRQDIA